MEPKKSDGFGLGMLALVGILGAAAGFVAANALGGEKKAPKALPAGHEAESDEEDDELDDEEGEDSEELPAAPAGRAPVSAQPNVAPRARTVRSPSTRPAATQARPKSPSVPRRKGRSAMKTPKAAAKA